MPFCLEYSLDSVQFKPGSLEFFFVLSSQICVLHVGIQNLDLVIRPDDSVILPAFLLNLMMR